MAPAQEICFKTATELAAMIKAGQIGSEELLDIYLARVEKYNAKLNAIIVLDKDRARQQAKAADATVKSGAKLGALHGVPMTIKESYDVAGLPTTFGYSHFKNNIATEDALAVQRLKAAGAIIFGKTNVPVALADFQSYNDIYGTTNNPWDHTRIPGGSSGGSAAALAAGLTGFESGSDIGGSIRNPAHFCGVFGHKPTFGLLPTRGHSPIKAMAPTELSVIGPMARSAHDLRIGVGIMAGPDELMATGYKLDLPTLGQSSLGQLKVAIWGNDELAPVASEVEECLRLVANAITAAGGQADFNARPDFDMAASHAAYQTLLHATMASRQSDDDYQHLQQEATKLGSKDQSERASTLRRQLASTRQYNQANEIRTQCRWAWHEFFKQYDAMLMPVTATPAFPHDHSAPGSRTLMVDHQERPYFEQVFWAGVAISNCLPATVVPVGQSQEGLPIGIQIMGKEYGDLETIGIAELLEDAGFCFQIPPDYAA